jgi:cytochrome P450
MSISDDLMFYPPGRDFSRPFDPPEILLRMQTKNPISRVRIWDNSTPWLFLRYEDGRNALTDDRMSNDPTRPGFPEKSAAYAATLGLDQNLRTYDNPKHDVHKRMVIRDFTVRRVESIRPVIEAKIDELLDQMLASERPVDLTQTFASPLPTTVICEILGVPYRDREFFGDRAWVINSAASTHEEATKAGNELSAFLNELIDIKQENPGDDLMSRLVHEQLNEGLLERHEVASIARLILIAGHETTAKTIALGLLVLLENPEALAEVRTSSDQALIMNTVDEILRYTSVLHNGRRRVATEDVEIGGQLIRAGEGIIVANNVCDRDEKVFPDAARFDIHRENARATMAFGYGIHQCLGQLLSRVEMQIVHDRIWKRIPSLSLAVPFSELVFQEESSAFALQSLPVTWSG